MENKTQIFEPLKMFMSIKSLFYIAFILVFFNPYTVKADNLNKMRQTLHEYTTKLESPEGGGLEGPKETINDFAVFLNENRDDILNNFKFIANNSVTKSIILEGFQYLPSVEYTDFLAAVLEAKKKSDLNDEVVIRAFSPGGNKYGFIAFNYKNPKIIELCNKAKSMVNSDKNFQNSMDRILSGKEWEEFEAVALNEDHHPEKLPPNISLIPPKVSPTAKHQASLQTPLPHVTGTAEWPKPTPTVTTAKPNTKPQPTPATQTETQKEPRLLWLIAVAVVLGILGILGYRKRKG